MYLWSNNAGLVVFSGQLYHYQRTLLNLGMGQSGYYTDQAPVYQKELKCILKASVTIGGRHVHDLI